MSCVIQVYIYTPEYGMFYSNIYHSTCSNRSVRLTRCEPSLFGNVTPTTPTPTPTPTPAFSSSYRKSVIIKKQRRKPKHHTTSGTTTITTMSTAKQQMVLHHQHPMDRHTMAVNLARRYTVQNENDLMQVRLMTTRSFRSVLHGP